MKNIVWQEHHITFISSFSFFCTIEINQTLSFKHFLAIAAIDHESPTQFL
jgi:hypothetical protein